MSDHDPGDKHRGYPLGGGWRHPADAQDGDPQLTAAECYLSLARRQLRGFRDPLGVPSIWRSCDALADEDWEPSEAAAENVRYALSLLHGWFGEEVAA